MSESSAKTMLNEAEKHATHVRDTDNGNYHLRCVIVWCASAVVVALEDVAAAVRERPRSSNSFGD